MFRQRILWLIVLVVIAILGIINLLSHLLVFFADFEGFGAMEFFEASSESACSLSASMAISSFKRLQRFAVAPMVTI